MKVKETEVQGKQILNINSGAIHIENKVDLLSRQAWFYLVYKAIPYLETQETFSIYLSELKKGIRYNSTNNEHLKKALRQLVETTLEWNILNKDDEEWGIATLLADCEIKKGSGICEYSFSPKVKKKFINPKMYLKLNLVISSMFSSKHSLALYCLAIDYLNFKTNYGEKNLSIEQLRKYLGLEKSPLYPRVVDLHRRIIKSSLIEINSNSDINLEITPIKEHKKITGFKFKMNLKKEHLDFYTSNINNFEKIGVEVEPKEDIVLKNDIKLISNFSLESEELKQFFSKNKISITTKTMISKLAELMEFFKDRSIVEKYLIYLMNYVNSQLDSNSNKIKSLSGFYVGLVKDDTQISNYLTDLELNNRKLEREKKEKDLALRKDLEKEYQKYLSNNFKEYILNNINKFGDKIMSLLKEEILDKNRFLSEHLIKKKHGGSVDLYLLTDPNPYYIGTKTAILEELDAYRDRFEYKEITFEDWMSQNKNLS